MRLSTIRENRLRERTKAARRSLCRLIICLFLPLAAHAQATQNATNPIRDTDRPLEYGPLIQGGVGLTEDRGSLRFFMAGLHAGKVLTSNKGPGLLHGNFELAGEFFPFWQSYTPRFQRVSCTAIPGT